MMATTSHERVPRMYEPVILNLRQIQKQIHFFLLAFRADATAFSVC